MQCRVGMWGGGVNGIKIDQQKVFKMCSLKIKSEPFEKNNKRSLKETRINKD